MKVLPGTAAVSIVAWNVNVSVAPWARMFPAPLQSIVMRPETTVAEVGAVPAVCVSDDGT